MKKKITNQTIMGMKGKEKIAMLTAFDYPSALFGERAGAEIILVGDSLGQAVLGHDNTLPVTMEAMLHHTRAAGRGCKNAYLVADMPFGSYQTGPEQAFGNAARFLKEAGAESIKIDRKSVV